MYFGVESQEVTQVLNRRGRGLDEQRQGRDPQELTVQQFAAPLLGLVSDGLGQLRQRGTKLRPSALSRVDSSLTAGGVGCIGSGQSGSNRDYRASRWNRG